MIAGWFNAHFDSTFVEIEQKLRKRVERKRNKELVCYSGHRQRKDQTTRVIILSHTFLILTQDEQNKGQDEMKIYTGIEQIRNDSFIAYLSNYLRMKFSNFFKFLQKPIFKYLRKVYAFGSVFCMFWDSTNGECSTEPDAQVFLQQVIANK